MEISPLTWRFFSFLYKETKVTFYTIIMGTLCYNCFLQFS